MVLLAAALLGSALLGGCVGVAEERHAQLDEIGDVQLTTVVCASEAGAEATCPTGNSRQPAGNGRFQLLVAYRVPATVTVPTSIAATEGTISLLFSPTYSAELERLAPIARGSNRQWLGYISPAFEFSALDSDRRATLTSRFGLVRGARGEPWAGPFGYRTLVGYREADPDPQRPVTCGSELAEPNEDRTTLCQDWPTQDEVGAEHSVPTRDLGIITGALGAATRGSTGTVRFTLAYDGHGPGPTVALAAATTVPGGSATAGVPSVAPAGPGATEVPVTVAVPASVAPGDYEVVLTASLPNGQTRSGSGRIRVTGPPPVDRQPPEFDIKLGSLPRVARARRFGLRPEVSCSEPCRLTAVLRMRRGGAFVGTYREAAAHPGRRRLRVRIRRAAAARMMRARRTALTLRVVARDANGNRRTRSVRLTMRR